MGFPSHGMVLCVSSGETVKFLEPANNAAIGDRMVVAGYTGETATEIQCSRRRCWKQSSLTLPQMPMEFHL